MLAAFIVGTECVISCRTTNASRHERSSSDATSRLCGWPSPASSIRLPEGSPDAPTAPCATPGAHEANAPLNLNRQEHHVFIFIPRFFHFQKSLIVILYLIFFTVHFLNGQRIKVFTTTFGILLYIY